MDKSNSISEIAKALCAFQSELSGVKKNSKNPFFNSKYADLGEIWDSIREILTKNGLSVAQTSTKSIETISTVDVNPKTGVITNETKFVTNVITVLMHTSGEYITGELSVPLAKSDPQGLGSAITYARRYALSAMLGIHSEDDDSESNKDGEGKPASKDELLSLATLANDTLASIALVGSQAEDYRKQIKRFFISKEAESLRATIATLQNIKEHQLQAKAENQKPVVQSVEELPMVDDLPPEPEPQQETPAELKVVYDKIRRGWEMTAKYSSQQSRHNSIKKADHLGVDTLEQCTDLVKLNAYYKFLLVEYGKQNKPQKPTLEESRKAVEDYINSHSSDYTDEQIQAHASSLEQLYASKDVDGLQSMLIGLQKASSVPFGN